jgi:hypothetical protein
MGITGPQFFYFPTLNHHELPSSATNCLQVKMLLVASRIYRLTQHWRLCLCPVQLQTRIWCWTRVFLLDLRFTCCWLQRGHTVFWVVTPRSPKRAQCFRGTYCSHHQGQTVKQGRNQHKQTWLATCLCLFFTSLTLLPWRWRQCVSQKN